MNYTIGCTTKSSSGERITHVGCVTDTGLYQRFTEQEAINRIRSGDHFKVVKDGYTVTVIIAKHEGREFLKTERDGTRADNLLSLKHCNEVPRPVAPPVRVNPVGTHGVTL